MRMVSLTEFDRLIYEREIRPFLPDRLFDAHSHLLPDRFHPRLAETMPLAKDPLLGDVDLPYLQAWWQTLFPDCTARGMVMGFPTIDVEMERENAFVAESARAMDLPFAMLVRPQFTEAYLESEIRRLKPSVLKPYMVFVKDKDPGSAAITDLIPEAQLALANAYGLAVMLHVAKARGMADPDNLKDINRLVREYPRCKFILAHCGRCFILPNMEDALAHLPIAENLWLDTSAVCDTGVFISLLGHYDRTRILFGTDLVTAAGFRGSYVRLGMSWHMCTADMVARRGGMADKTTFAAYESLCALCCAMRFHKVGESERRNIFHDNAIAVFGNASPNS